MKRITEEIGRKLVQEGLLTEDRLTECLQSAETEGISLDQILISRGLVPEDHVLQLLSHALFLPYFTDLTDFEVPMDFVDRIPVHFARAYNLVGVGAENGIMRVATCSPLSVHPMDELASLLGLEIEPVLAPRIEISALINQGYQSKADLVDEALEGLDEDEILGAAKEVELAEDVLDVHNKAPIIKLVNMILFRALKMRASDIHIQPYEEKLQIRYRIDGVLHDVLTPPKQVQEAIISRVKVMGRMDIAERRMPQDGRATIRVADAEVDLRISSVPTNYGERIVLRLLDKSARLYALEELGLSDDGQDLMAELIRYSHGIIFVTGPTGSGKTTTLYAVLNRLNSKEKNVITIEDPIEYHLKGISQIQVATKKGLTFAEGLRSLLRQDPDVMMVGEVRDKETATIAIQSALTGHLVFSTLHTNDASGAVTRMLDLGVEPYLVSSTVQAALAQRLVRLICPHCRVSYKPSVEELGEVGLTFDDIPSGLLYKGERCGKCMDTGYLGRTGIFELLLAEDNVRTQIMRREGASFIKKNAVDRGLITLRMDGAKKVAKGLTTVEEVIKVTQMDVF
ncbi:MAG: type II secretion system ATPase GspE [Planctomycetota bacterium]|jgi:general secretion pathway protein E